MRKTSLLLGLLLSLGASAQPREPQPLELSKVPREGSAPADFVPAGWKVEDTVRGDLDKDGREDVALQLVEDVPAKEDEVVDRARALLVLLSTEDGKLRRAGASNQVLYCTTCAGTLGGSGGGVVKIQKGVLLVDQLRGSRESVHTVLRFRYEPKTGRFALIGQDVERSDRLSGETTSESTNTLTGLRITEKRQYQPEQDKEVLVSKEKSKVPVKKQYLEDVDIEKF